MIQYTDEVLLNFTLLGTALPGSRSCNSLWLRLCKDLGTIRHLEDKAYLPGRGAASAPFHFTLPGPGWMTA